MKYLEKLIRPDLLAFRPYQSARTQTQPGRIWLNANESPWEAAVHIDINNINRYPHNPQALSATLANYYGVNQDQILLTRGSDEGMDCLVRLLCRPNQDAVMTCPPTFSMYAVCATLQGAKVIDMPLLPETFQLDVAKIKKVWTPQVKLIFLCSPNNPTGNLLTSNDIFSLCEYFQDKSLIVVDEAYIEFADQASLATQINQYDNLVILRTLSKAFGLAGARVGALLAQAPLIAWLKKIMPPYPLSTLSMVAVSQIFNPEKLSQISGQLQIIKQQRKLLLSELTTLPGIKKIWPTQANFILIAVEDAQAVINACQQQGIILRSMHHSGLVNNLRISIGLPEENAQLLKVLRKSCHPGAVRSTELGMTRESERKLWR